MYCFPPPSLDQENIGGPRVEERLFIGLGSGRWMDGSPLEIDSFVPYPARENPSNSDGPAGCGLLVVEEGGSEDQESYFTLEECAKERKSICKVILN